MVILKLCLNSWDWRKVLYNRNLENFLSNNRFIDLRLKPILLKFGPSFFINLTKMPGSILDNFDLRLTGLQHYNGLVYRPIVDRLNILFLIAGKHGWSNLNPLLRLILEWWLKSVIQVDSWFGNKRLVVSYVDNWPFKVSLISRG